MLGFGRVRLPCSHLPRARLRRRKATHALRATPSQTCLRLCRVACAIAIATVHTILFSPPRALLATQIALHPVNVLEQPSSWARIPLNKLIWQTSLQLGVWLINMEPSASLMGWIRATRPSAGLAMTRQWMARRIQSTSLLLVATSSFQVQVQLFQVHFARISCMTWAPMSPVSHSRCRSNTRSLRCVPPTTAIVHHHHRRRRRPLLLLLLRRPLLLVLSRGCRQSNLRFPSLFWSPRRTSLMYRAHPPSFKVKVRSAFHK